MGLLNQQKSILPEAVPMKLAAPPQDIMDKIEEANAAPTKSPAAPQKPLTKMEIAQKKWESEVETIRASLDLEQLIFDGFVTSEISLFKGVFKVLFKSLNHDQVAEVFSQAAKDTEGEIVGVFENRHSLLLISESIQALNGADLPTDRSDKVKIFGKQNSALVVKLGEKYNQFDAAIKLLLSDGPEGTLADEVKKS